MNTHFKYIYSAALVVAGLAFGSCSDLLDETPDNRVEITSPEKVQLLLTSAYPGASPALLEELFSDNLVDNNVEVPGCHRSPYYQFQDEAFQWLNINNYSTGTDDTPYDIWERYYAGISVCNHALEAMDKMEARDEKMVAKLAPYRGEALVLRAYLHFVLTNVFAMQYKNETMSELDQGVPYVTEVEDVVHIDYDRITVADDYDFIEADLKAGLPLIDDNYMTQPKFHMNLRAAHAFAARFYLYKHDWSKCIEHADAALGTSPSSMLRNWAELKDFSESNQYKNWLDDVQCNANFLMQPVYSVFDRMVTNCRHAYNGSRDGNASGDSQYTNAPCGIYLYGSGPCWSNRLPNRGFGGLYISSQGQEFGVFSFQLNEYFEYTDKIAGIGYVHMVRHPLTAEETLLCRAEAKFYMGNDAGCLEDLNLWTASKLCEKELTQSNIDGFYGNERYKDWHNDTHMAEIGWSAADVARAAANPNMIDCILHFRRIEMLYEGHRWEDIRRYGVTVRHRWQGPHETVVHQDSLIWSDPRRVIQLPQLVIDANLNPTDRTQGSSRTAYPSADGQSMKIK